MLDAAPRHEAFALAVLRPLTCLPSAFAASRTTALGVRDGQVRSVQAERDTRHVAKHACMHVACKAACWPALLGTVTW